jgi:outer membrane lipoprotein-sorting protein
VVLDGEDIIKIADKLQLDEYTILELNPTIKNYTDVKVGQSILIPSTFAKTVVVYIDAKNFLPIYQKIIDSKGLVSEYEYHELIINPIISDEEFTKAYKGYSF